MQLPMQQPQQSLPQQPQQQPQGENQGKPFPSSSSEAVQFSNDILQVLYDERTHGNIVKQLSGSSDNPAQGVGMVAANIVGNRVADVKAQTNRKIEMRLVVEALKDGVIPELAEIAENNGLFTMSEQDKAQATQTGITILDDMGKGRK